MHALLLTHGQLGLPDPWQATIEASLRLIDELEREITDCEREVRRLGADHRDVPLLVTVPGISWVLAYTIAADARTCSGESSTSRTPPSSAVAFPSSQRSFATVTRSP